MNKFSSEDYEYFNILIHLMERVLKLKHSIILVKDKKLFDKYVSNPACKGDVWGLAIREYGMIWLNEESMAGNARILACSIIIHEILHIAYPKASESWIEKETEKYTGLSTKNI